jgi:hypothetical protein
VGQFEIRVMVTPRMRTFFESLSLGSGAILIALLSVAIVWPLCSVLSGALRWLSVIVVPLVLAYSLYWLPTWLGSDASDYGAWEGLCVGAWFLAGAIPSAAIVLIYRWRHPPGKTQD